MKKSLIIAAAILTLAACTKEDSTKWIDGTQWKYRQQNSEGYKTECNLTLMNGSEVYYYKGFPPSYGYAYTEYRYYITSYSYDGKNSGTIQLRGLNYYASDGTATFTLNYDQSKLSISAPDFYCTLDRTK